MGKNRTKSTQKLVQEHENYEEQEQEKNEKVYVAHYKDYACHVQPLHDPAAAAVGIAYNYDVEREIKEDIVTLSPPSVLPSGCFHGDNNNTTSSSSVVSSGGSGSGSSGDNNNNNISSSCVFQHEDAGLVVECFCVGRKKKKKYQQSTSGAVDFHHKLSELEVALKASERVREEAQKETNSLRTYVGNVEAAAAGLLSRIQELEHLLALSSMVKSGYNIDVVRGRIVTAATREVQKHAAQAAQAVAAAREPTMELDKMRRETNALRKAQWEEIKRLNFEAAETRMLYEASRSKIQDLTNLSQKLTQNLEQQSSKLEESQKSHQAELALLQKQHEMMKAVAKERGSQNAELKKANDISKIKMRNSEKKPERVVLEKKDLVLQVKSLQGHKMSATIAHYDHELHKVRASLGAEKAQLLVELARLQHNNQRLRGEVGDW